ncbi:hypothetical protein [Paenibacillus sp. sgz302251]
MTEPNLDRFSIRFADEWQPRPWPVVEEENELHIEDESESEENG